jgi:hypothetical protein
MIKVTIRIGMDEPPNDVVFCPVLACDYCGYPVEVSSRPGNLIWYEPPDDPGYLAGESQEVFAAHMGRCETALRRQKGWPEQGPHVLARELPRLLAINLGIRDAHYWPEAAAQIEGMGIVERGVEQPLAGVTRGKGISREAREGEQGR